MGILNLKYKAHKMVNLLFYCVFFVIGFVIGFLGNKIDFNKLLNQVLFIDNAYAVTLNGFPSDLTVPSKYNFYKEETIFNIFNQMVKYNNLDLDFSNYSNVVASATSTSGYAYYRYWFSNEPILINNNIASPSVGSNYIIIQVRSNGTIIDPSSVWTYINYNNIANESSYFQKWSSTGTNYEHQYYSTKEFASNSYFTFKGLLDFSDYTLKLEFNKNLFKDNNDFKQVCVENGSSYAITRIDNPENLEYMTDYDYIWFPYKFNINDIKKFNFSNASDEEIYFKEENVYIPGLTFNGNVLTRNNDNVYEFSNLSYHFYDSKEKIDSVFDDEILGGNLNYKGYINKYSYYGWSSLLFNVWFDYRDGNNFNFFPIIIFNITSSTISLGSSNTIHGGGGLSIPFDEEIEDIKNYCFYIKNDYVVTKVHLDEFKDVDGNVPTQNGDFQFSTSKNENSISSSGFMSQVNDFIFRIWDVIDFIRINIYNFYLSMPLLVRMFFISILVLLIIKFIIGMVVS